MSVECSQIGSEWGRCKGEGAFPCRYRILKFGGQNVYRTDGNKLNTPGFSAFLHGIDVTVFFTFSPLNFGVTLRLIIKIAAFSPQIIFLAILRTSIDRFPPEN
jgi:hypothetical protein